MVQEKEKMYLWKGRSKMELEIENYDEKRIQKEQCEKWKRQGWGIGVMREEGNHLEVGWVGDKS